MILEATPAPVWGQHLPTKDALAEAHQSQEKPLDCFSTSKLKVTNTSPFEIYFSP